MAKIDWKRVKDFINKYLLVEATVFALLLVLDLVSKAAIDKNMELHESVGVIPHLFNFTYVQNEGSAFSLFKDVPGYKTVNIVVTIIAILVLGFFLYKFRKGSRLLRVSLVMIMAGAFGNLVDRCAFGYVRDFIGFAFWEEFPIFNFADCALTIGVVLFAVYLIFIYREPDKKKKDGQTFTPGVTGGFTSGENKHDGE